MVRATVRRLGAVAVFAGALVLFVAAPASAHASLLDSSPAPGEILKKTPKQVTLTFTESVSVSAGGVRVYDSKSTRVDSGDVESSEHVVRLQLPDLEDGAYVVTWRVTSADSHPISGAFTFQIGNTSNATSPRTQALADQLLDAERGDQLVGTVYGVTRGLLFAGLALVIGATAFGVLVSARVRASATRRRIVWIGWTTTVVATFVGLLVYGPYAAGLGLGRTFDSTLIGDTLSTRYGQIGVARLVLLLLATPVLRVLARSKGDEPQPIPRVWLGVGGALALLVAATPGLGGHASSGDLVPLAVVTDTVHVLAMAVWIGGLVILGFVVLRWSSVQEIRAPAERWSRLAFWCVAAIVATGAFQTWRQVGNLTALRTTEYGRMLIIKILLFAGLLMLAIFSRESVRYLFPGRDPDPASSRSTRRVPLVAGGADDDAEPELTPEEIAEYEAWELRRLRLSVWVEVGVAILVLAVTALLVNAVPAENAAATESGNAIGVTMKANDVWVDIVVVPGRSGRNAVHVSALTPKGAPKDVEDLSIAFALPARNIAEIEVPLKRISAGHYTSTSFSIPIAGTWTVTAEAVVSEFTERTLHAKIEIGET